MYLEAYSRRENIKFMNIREGPQDQDIKEIVRDFLELELEYLDARNVEFQRFITKHPFNTQRAVNLSFSTSNCYQLTVKVFFL